MSSLYLIYIEITFKILFCLTAQCAWGHNKGGIMRGFQKGQSMVYTADIWRSLGRKLAKQSWCCLDDLWVGVLMSPTATHLTQAEHI